MPNDGDRDGLLQQWGDEIEAVSPAKIQELAARLSYPLPERLVEILTTYGPLYIEEPMVFEIEWRRIDGEPIRPDEVDETVSEDDIYGLSSADRIIEMIDQISLYAGDNDALPPHFLPITTSNLNNVILLDLSPDGNGSVWAWGPRNAPWGEGDNEYIGFVANDIDDFLFNRLRPDDP